MSFIEKARERLEEVKVKGVRGVIEEVRGSSGGSKGILGLGGNPELPTIKEIREKGVVAVLEQKFPRVKEIREKGVLARIRPMEGGSSTSPSPASKSPPLIEEKEVKVRGARVLQ